MYKPTDDLILEHRDELPKEVRSYIKIDEISHQEISLITRDDHTTLVIWDMLTYRTLFPYTNTLWELNYVTLNELKALTKKVKESGSPERTEPESQAS